MNTYTVWLDGIPDVENVNLGTAQAVYDELIAQGYENVVIEQHQYTNANPPWRDKKWQYGQYNHIMQRFKALGFVPPSEKNTDKRG